MRRTTAQQGAIAATLVARTAILSSYRWDLVGCIVVNLNKGIWCWLALCRRCTAWRTSGWSPTARQTPVLSAGGWTWFSHSYAKMRIMHLQGEINSPIKEPREEIYFSGLCIHKEKRFSGNIATKWTEFSGYVPLSWKRRVFSWHHGVALIWQLCAGRDCYKWARTGRAYSSGQRKSQDCRLIQDLWCNYGNASYPLLENGNIL